MAKTNPGGTPANLRPVPLTPERRCTRKHRLNKRRAEVLIQGELHIKMLQLRRQGKSPADIAKELGVSRETVRRELLLVLKAAAEQIQEEVAYYRAMESMKLDDYEQRMARILYSDDARWQKEVFIKGEPMMMDVDGEEQRMKAVDRLLKIQERRAALWGLDAPKKVEEEKPASIIPIETLTIQLNGVVLPMLGKIIAGEIIGNGTLIEE